MLKTRVITAFALLFALLPGLFLSPQWVWALIAVVVAGLAGWEWGGFSRYTPVQRIAYALLVAGLCFFPGLTMPQLLGIVDTAVLTATPNMAELRPLMPLHALSALFWLLAVPLWLKHKWQLRNPLLAALVGFLVIIPTCFALIQLRLLGATVLFFTMGTVWIADIAAYFSGRRFGKGKLAPTISPGKTREGAYGATIAVILYGLILRSTFGFEQQSILLWIPALVLVTGISIIGDLFESLLKRQAGIKDSSNLLPGHGGVMDRIDSLTSTLPMITCFWLLSSY
jgi:phosphatidate cytidylyltransferase